MNYSKQSLYMHAIQWVRKNISDIIQEKTYNSYYPNYYRLYI